MRNYVIAAAALMMGTPALAGPILTDDFSTPGTFTSAYTYKVPTPGNNVAATEYTVATDAYPWNPNFASYGDHTSGTGNYMVVNGAGAQDNIWRNATPVALTAGTAYRFSFALSDACCNTGFNNGVDPSPPALGLSYVSSSTRVANATAFGGTFALTPGTAPGVWQVVGTNFTVGATDSYYFSIVNLNTQSAGNDFGLDDITVAAVPEAATWAMMIMGFGMIGVAARRRTRTRANIAVA